MEQNDKKQRRRTLLGAAFLMATSAIGPGFLTQTSLFTEKLGASFGSVILLSVALDIVAQMNVWRIIAVSGKRAQDIANMIFPGFGVALTVLIVVGGMIFNIGNIAGTGLALNSILTLSVQEAAIFSALIAILLFLVKEAGKAMDWFAQVFGILMIGLMLYVAWSSSPPLLLAVQKSFIPDKFDFFAMVTIVGGTVGGYITFSGGHRLLDAGISGPEAVGPATRGASTGILIASIMRLLLFTAALGVVTAGAKLHASNPPASVFYNAAGALGVEFFGIVMWSAAITSVVGSAYTSISFLRSVIPWVEKNTQLSVIYFIGFATLVFITIGSPVKILIAAGTINGFILPVALGLMVFAAIGPKRRQIVGDYRHPLWMTVSGILVVLVMLGATIYTVFIK